MRRYNYDLSHFSYNVGDIGRLQTQCIIPVYPGDSMALSLQGVFRLSPLRRNLVLDAQVDNFIFYVPHRHIYGDDWITFIQEGMKETVTFTAGPASSGESYFGTRRESTELWPLWVVGGYNQIWNRYFRAPTDTASERTLSQVEPVGRGQEHGVLCARIKKPWTTGIEGEPVAADREVPSTSVVDLVEFRQQQAQLRTETKRSFFATRYTDILRELWGGRATTDADQRPTLLMRKTGTLSGYDVDGTGDSSLGAFSGKSAAQLSCGMPPKFFPEHGCVWVMSLVRFPMVHGRERHYLVGKSNPNYTDIGGDPEVIASQGPISTNNSEWFNTTGTTDLGAIPYGQHYRYQPDYVHTKYQSLTGFPFIQDIPVDANSARYHISGEYDNTFQSLALAQWSSASRINCMVRRLAPTGASSLFAGA